ncbi:MAG: hypothetical protein LBS70_07795 [Candidatus Accumulibacter sp.]|jgi:hypothetical protein|nr:hypothetical protein [Accumulibacter sp.]
MIGISLLSALSDGAKPDENDADEAAFHDAESAAAWLSGQTRAETPAMLSVFQREIEAFNLQDPSPRERFKTLEVLRKTASALGEAGRRLCEDKPLPLAPAEQAALDAGRRLWRSYAIGYRQCLQDCLDGDDSLARRAARVAHRAAFCLRVEQLAGYAGGIGPGPGFWKHFHALYVAAERLACERETVEDRLLAETRTSSVSGQYTMALMLHLARPFTLTAAEFGAAVRWLARWRELARVEERGDTDPRYGSIALDLTVDRPFRETGETRYARWLSLGGVLRKIRRRIDGLTAGESPQSLKLGDTLPADACLTLLKTLFDRLQHPQPSAPAVDPSALPAMEVGVGLSAVHRLLTEPNAAPAKAPAAARPARGARAAVPAPGAVERWRLSRRERAELELLRPAGAGVSRVGLHGLLGVVHTGGCRLAAVSALRTDEDGTLHCLAVPLVGAVIPRVAEIRNWMTGEVVRHPALQLTAPGALDLLLLPAGMLVRAAGVRFFDVAGELVFDLRVTDCVERTGDVEFWRVAVNE